jgi:hypothetical protein
MKEIVRPRRLSQQDVLRLASHLTDRDRWIARDCFEFRVLTTSQIRRLYFTGTSSTGSAHHCRWARAPPRITGFSMRQAR